MTFIYLRHESSLYTPFEVMFGRKAVLPVDCEEGLPFPPLHSGVGMEDVRMQDGKRDLAVMCRLKLM